MTSIDYEAEYNNRRRVPDHADISARWQAASADYRRTAKAAALLDRPYGRAERQRYDLFPAGDAKAAPLLVFIHGGYWQRGDRKDYSFLARAFNAEGITVAVPSYSLCPAVSVMDIVGEMRQCLAALWKDTGRRPVVTGNSAGGHLTAAMVGTDWSRVAAGLPADLVRAGCAISGIFDLAPLIGTSIDEALHLNAASAREAGPLFWTPPKGRTLAAAVGGDESAEFLRQNATIAETWRRGGVDAESMVVPGTNHFTVVDQLAEPGTALHTRVADLARRFSGGG